MKHDVTGYDFGKWRHLTFTVLLLSSFVSNATAESPSEIDAEAKAWKEELAERSHWWSLQAPKLIRPPEVADSHWAQEPVDRFIFAKLSEAELFSCKTGRG